MLHCPLSPRVCSNSCSFSCNLAISSSVTSFFFCLQSFPASGSFPKSPLSPSGGQSIGVSVEIDFQFGMKLEVMICFFLYDFPIDPLPFVDNSSFPQSTAVCCKFRSVSGLLFFFGLILYLCANTTHTHTLNYYCFKINLDNSSVTFSTLFNFFKIICSRPFGFPGDSVGSNSPAEQETWVQFLGWEDSPGDGDGIPLQYSCLAQLVNNLPAMWETWS